MLSDTNSGVEQAVKILSDGGLVAFATETVYGLGADATNDHAVASIFATKGRPQFNPLIIHVSDISSAERFVDITDDARRLAIAFWPGPMTLVLPLRPDSGLSPLVTAGLETVGIRIPAHVGARALLSQFGGAVAAPSANPSGRISPTTPQHVVDGLGGKVDAILDGGPCAVGVESTIIGFDGGPTLLRAGGVPREAIEAALGTQLAVRAAHDVINAPGQLLSHYAPDAPIRLNATTARDGEIMIGFQIRADSLNEG
jgi:L-threonylcarbamoyladenylate synthase